MNKQFNPIDEDQNLPRKQPNDWNRPESDQPDAGYGENTGKGAAMTLADEDDDSWTTTATRDGAPLTPTFSDGQGGEDYLDDPEANPDENEYEEEEIEEEEEDGETPGIGDRDYGNGSPYPPTPAAPD